MNYEQTHYIVQQHMLLTFGMRVINTPRNSEFVAEGSLPAGLVNPASY